MYTYYYLSFLPWPLWYQYDHSGKLGFDEFSVLWDCLREWKGVFKKYDSDKSGTFNSYELRAALGASGTVTYCRVYIYAAV